VISVQVEVEESCLVTRVVVVGIQVLDGIQGVKELLKSLQGRDAVVLYLSVRL
jgi:hypothetical protein